MSYQLFETVSFGGSKAGLLTVGYTLFNPNGSVNTTRTTAGIVSLGDGQYAAMVTYPDGFRGYIQWDTGEVELLSVSAAVNPEEAENDKLELAKLNALPTTGDGAVPVNHNYGGTDALRYVTSSGAGIGDASVRAYLAVDYTAGHTEPSFVIATTTTGADGRWRQTLMLDTATYTFVFYKLQQFGPDTATIVVS